MFRFPHNPPEMTNILSAASFPQAAICRSSQPLSGFSARCLEDEQMLEAILRSNPHSDFLYVVDTRPKVRPLCLRNCEKQPYSVFLYVQVGFMFSNCAASAGSAHSQAPRKRADGLCVTRLTFLNGCECPKRICFRWSLLAERVRKPGCRKGLRK